MLWEIPRLKFGAYFNIFAKKRRHSDSVVAFSSINLGRFGDLTRRLSPLYFDEKDQRRG